MAVPNAVIGEQTGWGDWSPCPSGAPGPPPEATAQAFSAPLPLDEIARALVDVRAVVTTGVGSSLAHARYLLAPSHACRHLLLGRADAFLAPEPTRYEQDVRDVRDGRRTGARLFSQGLSPNARFPLAHIARYRSVVPRHRRLGGRARSRERRSRRSDDAGALVVRMPCAPEYEVLVRPIGPMVGFAVICASRTPSRAPTLACRPTRSRALRDAAARARAARGREPGGAVDPVVFVARTGTQRSRTTLAPNSPKACSCLACGVRCARARAWPRHEATGKAAHVRGARPRRSARRRAVRSRARPRDAAPPLAAPRGTTPGAPRRASSTRRW